MFQIWFQNVSDISAGQYHPISPIILTRDDPNQPTTWCFFLHFEGRHLRVGVCVFVSVSVCVYVCVSVSLSVTVCRCVCVLVHACFRGWVCVCKIRLMKLLFLHTIADLTHVDLTSNLTSLD